MKKISMKDFPFNGKGIDAIKFRFYYNKETNKVGCEGLVYYKNKRPHNFYECGLNNKMLKIIDKRRIIESVTKDSNHFKGYEIIEFFDDKVAGKIRDGEIFVTWKKALITSKRLDTSNLYNKDYECTYYSEGR